MDQFNELFGKYTGDKKYDKYGYHCTRCKYELEQISVKTVMEKIKKVFYCKNKQCEKYGDVTVLAIKNQRGLNDAHIFPSGRQRQGRVLR